MARLMRRLQYPPWRGRLVLLIRLFPVLFGVLGLFTVGPIGGLSFFVAGFGIYSLLSHIPARPRLAVTLASDQGHDRKMVLGGQIAEPRLDHEVIVDAQCVVARETMPRLPVPRDVPGLVADTFRKGAALGLYDDPSDDELREFLGKVAGYGQELETWLSNYEDARHQRLLEFDPVFRIDNDGEAQVRDLRLRLYFPREFEEIDDEQAVQEPPKRPGFVSRNQRIFAAIRPDSPRITPIFNAPLPEVIKGIAPTYSRDREHLIVEYNLGVLNHGPDHLHTGTCKLKAPAPGSYEIRWQASGGNLPEAAHGTVEIEIAPCPVPEQPLTGLEQVLAEREELVLD